MSDFIVFDRAVESLVSQGVPREKAVARLREQLPHAARLMDTQEQRREDVLEKEEQLAITKMARAIGLRVYNLSQARRSKQSPGIPDLWMMRSMFGGWWETKRQVGGDLSPAQAAFAHECVVANIHHGYGDRFAFAQWLEQHGFNAPPIPH